MGHEPPRNTGRGVTLWLGDCREIAPTLGRVDAVITDPPYGLNFEYAGYEDSRANLRALISAVMPWAVENAERVVVLPGITQVYLYPEPDWIMSVCWNTTGSFGAYGFTQWMPALLYGKDLRGFGSVNDGVLKSDVILFSGGEGVGFRREEDIDHPCPKPLNLMDRLVTRLTQPNALIVDPFTGSGSTGIAAVRNGRRFCGIEIEPRYFDTACRRISEELKRPRLPLPEPVKQPVQEVML